MQRSGLRQVWRRAHGGDLQHQVCGVRVQDQRAQAAPWGLLYPGPPKFHHQPQLA
jgi:hypothetical protein